MQQIDKSIPEYHDFLKGIKHRIHQARIQASRVVNRELTLLYWSIGREIVTAQRQNGWGENIVDQLSKDLRANFPGITGFSPRNLWTMRKIYIEYHNFPILQALSAELTWSQNVEILANVDTNAAREYYLKATLEMGWSTRVLAHQIKAQAYEQHHVVKKQHNFEKALPAHLAEQANLAMKDSYLLDFLGVSQPLLELELENKMINKIKDVILEFGYGFTFIGNQYHIKANGNDYYIDLLFYNRRLCSLVAIELKVGGFKPEYAGKMSFYLNLLDDFVKETNENPSIGIIMCSKRDSFEVEYTLRSINKPVGVSEYQFTKTLPKELVDKLPEIEALEKELTASIFHEGAEDRIRGENRVLEDL